ncbi:MAG: tRNA (N6-isopentenyl adenosine(37)-C2)-methylthiotransferase MiaB [Caldilineaceae bacterium]
MMIDTHGPSRAPAAEPGTKFHDGSEPSSQEPKTYHIWTIGCQMNVADSNHVAAELEHLGMQPAQALDDADVVVLNTCVVRQSAENKAIGKLGSLKPWREARPGRTLALMGCMVGVKPSAQLLDAYPQVDVFMPPSDPSPLTAYLQRDEISATSAGLAREFDETQHRTQDDASLATDQGIELQSVRHLAKNGEMPVAAYVPIVYGCSHACTFCIIPFRRGVERSRRAPDIIAEVQGLVAQGVREVTLLGQIVDRYGYDWRGDLGNSASVDAYQGAASDDVESFDLADLLREIHKIDGLWRIRFLTSHPNYMTDRILHAVRDLPKVCEHIEVPIQAGSDVVLERMKRGYTADEYRTLVRHIRDEIPGVAINTDIIVGFPGETDAQFEETVAVLEELKLDKAHLARYSPRPGTVSTRSMKDDVPEEVKVERHRRLERLQEQVCAVSNAAHLGEVVEILVEERYKGKWRGRTRQNKLVFVDSELPLRGHLVEAQITWTGPWSMQGRFVRDVSPSADRIAADTASQIWLDDLRAGSDFLSGTSIQRNQTAAH